MTLATPGISRIDHEVRARLGEATVVIQHDDATVDTVQRYHDELAEQEWARLGGHCMEFAVTLRAVREHLAPPADILDCGGGPGRYAVELARRGYSSALFDLSSRCLDLASKRAKEAGVALASFDLGSATDLQCHGNGGFDGILLLGPLYHLLDEHDRRQALREGRRVLRPGGLLFAAFNSRYAAFRFSAVHDPSWVVEEPERLQKLMDTGELPGRRPGELQFVARYAHPTEVAPLCASEGFEMVALLGAEGLVSMIEDKVDALPDAAWEAWVGLNYRVAQDPSILGCVGHLLAIARKPSTAAYASKGEP